MAAKNVFPWYIRKRPDHPSTDEENYDRKHPERNRYSPDRIRTWVFLKYNKWSFNVGLWYFWKQRNHFNTFIPTYYIRIFHFFSSPPFQRLVIVFVNHKMIFFSIKHIFSFDLIRWKLPLQKSQVKRNTFLDNLLFNLQKQKQRFFQFEIAKLCRLTEQNFGPTLAYCDLLSIFQSMCHVQAVRIAYFYFSKWPTSAANVICEN